MKKILLVSLIIISLTSCANKYNLLNPEKSYYKNTKTEDNIEVSYKYNTLRKKYKKYADKKDIRIASVKITNKSTEEIIFGSNFNLTDYHGNPLNIISTNEAYDKIRQHPATHLWYLLLSFLTFQTYDTNEHGLTETTSSIPIGLLIGPAISLGNLITAESANKKLKNELSTNDLTNKTIKPGETVFGLISIQDSDHPMIKGSLIK